MPFSKFLIIIGFLLYGIISDAQSLYFPSGSSNPAVQEKYEEAIYALMNVEHKRFVKLIQEIIEEEPKNFKALAHRAFHTFHITQGEYPFEKFAKAALDANPQGDVEEAFAKVLEMRLKNKKADVSVVWNRLAFRHNVAEAYFLLGNYYLEIGEVKNAHIAFYRIFKIDAAFPPAYNLMGHTSLELGFMKLAEELLIGYVNLVPKHPNSHHSLGDYYVKIENYGEAIRCYEKAFELNEVDFKFSKEKAKKLKEKLALE